jgi:hypothetical protein
MLQLLKTDPAAHRNDLVCSVGFTESVSGNTRSSTREDLPMPANKGAESKQGLIITLVGFVLLSIILGVTTYYGYAEQDALRKAATDAKNEAASAKKNRDWYKYVALKLKEYTGDLTKQETEELSVAPGKGTPGEDQPAYNSLFTDLQSRLAKDATTVEPYRQRVARLEEELRNRETSLQAERNNLKKEREDHQRLMAVREAELKEAKNDFEKAQAANVAARQKFEQDLLARLQEFGDMSQELEKVKKKAATDVQTLQRLDKTRQGEIGDLETALDKARKQLIPPDLQKFSSPKGKILRVDPSGQAWINLGSADHIRTQQGLTFSIFGAGIGGRGTTVRKGALEVVDVRGPHLSLAKITETVNPGSTPIQTGDLLVNPAWSPTMQGHVAIAGLIDLAGDGRDHSEELMRALRDQNVVIDAYVDLKDATIKGKMTFKTDYLILGEQPEFNASTLIREGDTRFERKTEILSKIADMQTEAKRLGTTVVPLRRFVALTGYQIPQGARSTSGFSYDSRIPSPSSNGQAKAAGKKPKEENKEESK